MKTKMPEMTPYQKLRLWARYLEREVKVAKFDMGEWKCGTVFCAGGHACCIPKFRKMGLNLASYEFGIVSPAYKGVDGALALSMFFGTGWEEMCRVAYPNEYPDSECILKSHVIRRIRELADRHKERAR